MVVDPIIDYQNAVLTQAWQRYYQLALSLALHVYDGSTLSPDLADTLHIVDQLIALHGDITP